VEDAKSALAQLTWADHFPGATDRSTWADAQHLGPDRTAPGLTTVGAVPDTGLTTGHLG
jgi:hypothetical protein